MAGIRDWLKPNGGPPALVVVGIGLVFAFWPVGVAFIVAGLGTRFYQWDLEKLIARLRH